MKLHSFAVAGSVLLSAITDARSIKSRQSPGLSTSAAVTGPPGLQRRYPIDVMQSTQPDVFNMFLVAMAAFQSISETEQFSYYQIGGIHGAPFIPWGESPSPSQDTSRGYCPHNSAIFAPWHRPYLSLFEQQVCAIALTEANKFTGNAAAQYLAAAGRVRLPYWDWASDSTASHIPDVCMQPTVTVIKPDSNGNPVSVSIANPLYQYKFTNDALRRRYFSGYWQTVDHTVRVPTNDPNPQSQNRLADLAMANSFLARQQNTFNLYSIQTFDQFSNTGTTAGNEPNTMTSLESIHNDIHVILGGNNGHMTYLKYAAHDPIFWLHHCNVDRLMAMYQVLSDSYVEPEVATGTFDRIVTWSDVDDINTPLYPFTRASGGFYTSAELNSPYNIWSLGYDYPEVPISYSGSPRSDLAAFTIEQINTLYSGRPSITSVRSISSGANNDTTVHRQSSLECTEKREYIVHVAFDPAQVDGPCEVLIFLGNYGSDPETRRLGSTYIGSVASLINTNNTIRPHTITGTVPLTRNLEMSHLSLDPNDTVPYLKKMLKWVAQTGSIEVPTEQLTSLEVGVSSSVVRTPMDNSKLPQWGSFETHYEVTRNKANGLTSASTSRINSVPAPPVEIGTHNSSEY